MLQFFMKKLRLFFGKIRDSLVILSPQKQEDISLGIFSVFGKSYWVRFPWLTIFLIFFQKLIMMMPGEIRVFLFQMIHCLDRLVHYVINFCSFCIGDQFFVSFQDGFVIA